MSKLVAFWIPMAGAMAVAALGCTAIALPELPSSSAAAPGELRLELLDARGERWPTGSVPRQPVLRVLGAPGADLAASSWLFRGRITQEDQDDLMRSPLRASTRARLVPSIGVELDGGMQLRPLAPLPAGAELTLVVAPWTPALASKTDGQLWFRVLKVGGGPQAGAEFIESWPADASPAVPPNLLRVALRFDGQVTGTEELALVDASGARMSGPAQLWPCPELGWPAGFCVAMPVAQALRGLGEFRLAGGSELRDLRGARLPPVILGFRSAAEPDRQAPIWRPPSCALDEQALDQACVLLSEAAITLRMAASESFRVLVEAAGRHAVGVAPRSDLLLSISGLPLDSRFKLRVWAWDAAGNLNLSGAWLRSSPALPTVAIVELLADPAGREPDQEFVELLNWGSQPVPLLGFSLSDDPQLRGDLIPNEVILPPHSRALWVSESFDPVAAGVPAGAMLVRTPGSLARAGLANRGEPLFLRDALGRRLSESPATPAPLSGVCVARRSAQMRPGGAALFAYAPACTPGRPTVWPE